MNKIIFSIIALFAVASVSISARKLPSTFAHRGCWLGTEVPENSVAAVEMAKRFGYKVIECDVHYTKDSVMVLMHDHMDMRRCIRRKSDYSKLDKPLNVADITYEELKRDYVLPSDNPALRTPVPTFEELMLACKKNGIMPLLHSDVVESYHVAQKMFGNKWIAFSSTYKKMKEARRISDCPILLSMDNVTSSQAIEKMKSIGGKIGLSSMGYKMMSADFINDLRKAGYDVQASIFPADEEIRAIRDRVSIVLSDWCFLPHKGVRPKSVSKKKNLQLNPNEHIDIQFGQSKYGATTVEMTFVGEIELVINGNRRYVLKHDTLSDEVIGMRFINSASSVEVIAHSKTNVKKLKARNYVF